jgi:hypothetical protein
VFHPITGIWFFFVGFVELTRTTSRVASVCNLLGNDATEQGCTDGPEGSSDSAVRPEGILEALTEIWIGVAGGYVVSKFPGRQNTASLGRLAIRIHPTPPSSHFCAVDWSEMVQNLTLRHVLERQSYRPSRGPLLSNKNLRQL